MKKCMVVNMKQEVSRLYLEDYIRLCGAFTYYHMNKIQHNNAKKNDTKRNINKGYKEDNSSD